ncbi:uncharacterized protein N7459_005752 [Penicillium hispanicum]|uniref:uncharacterized protein n=1 Tax=Penicillium hispanicum TaxID=1080232 RepID=UPI00253FBCD9|nr:uncharacterized protein N7459_005752 [Penicillium hispanicum]KAJ5579767.1 hypothetical protein N7459_005752 [Penicillium hispanicum]
MPMIANGFSHPQPQPRKPLRQAQTPRPDSSGSYTSHSPSPAATPHHQFWQLRNVQSAAAQKQGRSSPPPPAAIFPHYRPGGGQEESSGSTAWNSLELPAPAGLQSVLAICAI